MVFLAVDGNSILNRSFYGIKPLSTKSGIPTNAIYGFLKTLDRTIKDTGATHIAVAFDLPKPTFRHKMYDGYKANRKGMPEELAAQLPHVKQIIELLGYSIVEQEGYEADDILGTFARICGQSGTKCVISTGDRDSLQLVDQNVTVRLATNKEPVTYDTDKIKADYGVDPPLLIEVKALMGDNSDNIPGVKGIGEKTALDLIAKYGGIDYIYDNLEKIEIKPRQKELLSTSRDMAYISRDLAAICRDVPVCGDIDGYNITEGDRQALAEKLSSLEMYSLLSMYAADGETLAPAVLETVEIEIAIDPDIDQTAKALSNAECIDFLAEIDNRTLMRLKIIHHNKAYVFTKNPQAALENIIPAVKAKKRTQDAKTLYKWMLDSGLDLPVIDHDILLSAYLLDPLSSEYGIEGLRMKYLSGTVYNIKYDQADIEGIGRDDNDIAALPALCDMLAEQIHEQGMDRLLYEIELPLSGVLAHMEHHGFMLDREGVTSFGAELKAEIKTLADDIKELAEEDINPNSPKELGRILFEKLELPGGKKTKTGYSTDVDVLTKLLGQHPIIEKILSYRHVAKLNSTYADGLLNMVEQDGRIHTVFRQTETRTGRISSIEPNMQNIPVRTEQGRTLRKFFTAPEGRVLIDADYSQIELRILAAVSGDRQMIEAFNQDKDIHTITAAEVFGYAPELLPPELRTRAKAINFGIVYGIGAFSLSQDIGVSVAEAKRYIERYFDTYSGVKEYMDGIIERAKQERSVSTILGRIRPIPDINSSNRNIRSAAERIALNTPIQGTGADIIKIAMIRCHERLAEENLDARLILQVHDELIIEASQKDADRAAVILSEEMRDAADLAVQLVVDVNIGKTWYETKS
ncbi:MAG: DNA polymerase I [Oscillospiraceae bacterium]|nr:DNA polymerase I [Oscillospiraceae bacterium]